MDQFNRQQTRRQILKTAIGGAAGMVLGSPVMRLGARPQAAREAFPVVAVLHALATRLAVETLTEQDFTSLRQANKSLVAALEAGDVTRAMQSDDLFHDVFVRASANSEIRHALNRLMPKVRRLEYAQFGSLAGHTSVLQHQAIITACEQRLSEQAASLTEQNWLNLGQLIVQSLDDNQQRSQGG